MNPHHRFGSLGLLGAALVLAACSTGGAPAPIPSPIPGPTLGQADLKYTLLARFGPISWCDPDFYPIAQEDEQVLARQRLPEMEQDAQTYAAIRRHLGIEADKALSDSELLAVYRDWKLLNAVALTPTADGRFGFDLITETDVGLGKGVHTTGTIDTHGVIEVALQEDSFLTSCPICLARGTLIDTPNGMVPVESLGVGDLVWTLDANGRRVAMPLLRTGSTPVPASHRVVHLVLNDGRELWVSPGHALADGRAAGDLRVSDLVDGATVLTAELLPYAGGATFDVLPDGPTGFYWANGILLSSTLR
ncbi:MAG: Hint domain-containing protein [Chloroflexota bacterium]